MSYRPTTAAWALALVLLSAPRATAEAPAPLLRVSWVREQAARSCPDARSVERTVRERLGRDPFSDAAELAAEVWITHDGAGFVARIQLRDGQGELAGERTLRSDTSCAPLADAVALALALYIDPDAALAPRPAPPPPSAPAETRATQLASPLSAKAREEVPPAAAPRRVAGALSGSLVGAYGLLPDVALGARLEGELALGARFRAFVSGVFFPEQSTDGGEFAFGLSMGGLGGCFDFALGRVALAPCAGLFAGQLHSVVHELEPLDTGGHLWLAGSVLGRLRAQLIGTLFAELAGGAWLPLPPETFRVEGRTKSVFRQSAAAPTLAFGVGTTFR